SSRLASGRRGKAMKILKRIFGALSGLRPGPMTLSRRVTLTFALLIALNIAVGVLLCRLPEQVAAPDRYPDAFPHLMRAVTAFAAAFEAEQGTIRGYVISGEQRMLQVAAQAAERAERAHAEAKAVTTDNLVSSMLDMVMTSIRDWYRTVRDPQIELM